MPFLYCAKNNLTVLRLRLWFKTAKNDYVINSLVHIALNKEFEELRRLVVMKPSVLRQLQSLFCGITYSGDEKANPRADPFLEWLPLGASKDRARYVWPVIWARVHVPMETNTIRKNYGLEYCLQKTPELGAINCLHSKYVKQQVSEAFL